MKAKFAVAVLTLAFAASTVFAAEETKKAPSPAQKAQQEKMKACNADAGEKKIKGAERKKFMSECLGGKSEAAGSSACATSAAEKKLAGAAKSSFMKKCEADAKAPAPAEAPKAEAAKPAK